MTRRKTSFFMAVVLLICSLFIVKSYAWVNGQNYITLVWDDNDNAQGLRPETVYITINSGTNSEWTTELLQDEPTEITSGNVGLGVVKLTDVSGYTHTLEMISENQYTATYTLTQTTTDDDEEDNENNTSTAVREVITINLTNTIYNYTVSVIGTKTWDDNDDEQGIRPDEITVYLYANGEPTGDSYTLSEATDWEYEFTGLPKYEDGEAISYSIKEDVPDGYNVEYFEE
ncbi:MAG: Cna B-type domain-containing protein [Candidatus Gastranaerophilales bacterium]|nr:Cna B-type domain-containing protein [Candidatus Gastranaerophilales bacterium]